MLFVQFLPSYCFDPHLISSHVIRVLSKLSRCNVFKSLAWCLFVSKTCNNKNILFTKPSLGYVFLKPFCSVSKSRKHILHGLISLHFKQFILASGKFNFLLFNLFCTFVSNFYKVANLLGLFTIAKPTNFSGSWHKPRHS